MTDTLSDATFQGAVEACKGLQSDFDKAGALTRIARHAGDEARRQLVLEAARTIQSDRDRGRVMAKVFPAGE